MASSLPPAELDVRPLFAANRPPLGAILAAVDQLAIGQSLHLVAPMEPVPLYAMLQARGYDHAVHQRDDGAWLVEFTPAS